MSSLRIPVLTLSMIRILSRILLNMGISNRIAKWDSVEDLNVQFKDPSFDPLQDLVKQ